MIGTVLMKETGGICFKRAVDNDKCAYENPGRRKHRATPAVMYYTQCIGGGSLQQRHVESPLLVSCNPVG